MPNYGKSITRSKKDCCWRKIRFGHNSHIQQDVVSHFFSLPDRSRNEWHYPGLSHKTLSRPCRRASGQGHAQAPDNCQSRRWRPTDCTGIYAQRCLFSGAFVQAYHAHTGLLIQCMTRVAFCVATKRSSFLPTLSSLPKAFSFSCRYKRGQGQYSILEMRMRCVCVCVCVCWSLQYFADVIAFDFDLDAGSTSFSTKTVAVRDS